MLLKKKKKKRYLLSHAFGRLQRMRSLRECVVKTRYTKFPVMSENDAFCKKYYHIYINKWCFCCKRFYPNVKVLVQDWVHQCWTSSPMNIQMCIASLQLCSHRLMTMLSHHHITGTCTTLLVNSSVCNIIYRPVVANLHISIFLKW